MHTLVLSQKKTRKGVDTEAHRQACTQGEGHVTKAMSHPDITGHPMHPLVPKGAESIVEPFPTLEVALGVHLFQHTCISVQPPSVTETVMCMQ